MITDIKFLSRELGGFYFHSGFLSAAQQLYPRIKELITSNQYTQVVLVGHSYGASVAAILVHLVHVLAPELAIVGFLFGAAPMME